MYIINSAAIIETSAESKKKLALRVVCHYNTTGPMYVSGTNVYMNHTAWFIQYKSYCILSISA